MYILHAKKELFENRVIKRETAEDMSTSDAGSYYLRKTEVSGPPKCIHPIHLITLSEN